LTGFLRDYAFRNADEPTGISPKPSPQEYTEDFMKTFNSGLLRWALLAMLLSGGSAFADIMGPVFEDFQYPAGSLLDGQNGGTGWAGHWVGADDFFTGAGSLFYPGLLSSGNRAQFIPYNEAGSNVIRTINALGTDGATTWLSFLISIDGDVVGSDISADVRLDDGLGNHLYIGDPQSGRPNWGVLTQSGFIPSNIPIVSGVPVFVAVRFDLNANPAANDLVTVYFDPTPGLSLPSVPGISTNSYNFSAGHDVLALDGNVFQLTAVANYDPIRGGTSYADVSPASITPTPEPSSLTLMDTVLAICGIMIRRRMRASENGGSEIE
jgi:hypothetical protein